MDYRQGLRDGYNAAREDLLGAMGSAYLPTSMTTPMMLSEAPMQANAPAAKPKRRPSKYAKAYGKAYKMHRKKHPRAKHLTIVNKAHRTARAEMKKK